MAFYFTGGGISTATLAGGTLPASFTALAASGLSTLAQIAATATGNAHTLTCTSSTLSFSTANALYIRHTNLDGNSAISCLRPSDGFEAGAFGFHDTGGTSTFYNGCLFMGTGLVNTSGVEQGTIIPIMIFQAGAGMSGGSPRMLFTNTAAINFYKKNGSVHSHVGADGGWMINSDGSTETNSSLDVIGTTMLGSSTAQASRNNAANGFAVTIYNADGNVFQAIRHNVRKFQLVLSSGDVSVVDADNSSVVPWKIGLDGTGRCTAGGPVKMKGYTVAALPSGSVGDHAYVTDALAPTFLATVVGGGAIVTPVFYNGSNWVGG